MLDPRGDGCQARRGRAGAFLRGKSGPISWTRRPPENSSHARAKQQSEKTKGKKGKKGKKGTKHRLSTCSTKTTNSSVLGELMHVSCMHGEQAEGHPLVSGGAALVLVFDAGHRPAPWSFGYYAYLLATSWGGMVRFSAHFKHPMHH